MIPQKIWQTHRFPLDNLPAYIRAATGTWKDLNPEFEYSYVSNEEAIHQVDELQNGRFSKILRYPYLTGTALADIWRILVLQAYGGVYIDVDTVCIMPLTKFIDVHKDFVVEGQPPANAGASINMNQIAGEYAQYFGALNGFIASTPNNKLINAICDMAEKVCSILIARNEFIGPACGPELLTAVINKTWHELGDSIFDILDISRIPPDFDVYRFGEGDAGYIDLNGSFRWVDRIRKEYSFDITHMLDKFMNTKDASCMPSGGPTDPGLGAYRRMHEQVDIKLFRSSMHMGSRMMKAIPEEPK